MKKPLIILLCVVTFIISGCSQKINTITPEVNIEEHKGEILSYKIVKTEDVSMKALGERTLSSFSSKELDNLPENKRMKYWVIIENDIKDINEYSIRRTANKIVNELMLTNIDIDTIFILMYLDEERIKNGIGYDLASITWAPEGNPSKVDKYIATNNDRKNYKIITEINKNLDEYLQTRIKFIEGAKTSKVENINLTLNTSIKNNTLYINGNANLPNNSLISYEVTHKESFGSKGYEEGNTTVQNGKYSKSINLSSFSNGEIEVWVAFQTILGTSTKQPDDVIEIYGELGEKIIDSDAISLGGYMKRIEKTGVVRK